MQTFPVLAGQTRNSDTGKKDLCITMEEEDGSPSMVACQRVEVTNGTLTDDGDGAFSLSTGGGGGNSFETIAVPAGASVVADSSTDTLTLTETSFLTLTGTAATDTIDITQVTTDLGTDGLIAANAVALGTDTTNAYVADLTAGTYIDVSGGGAETANVTVTVDATEIEAVTFGAGGNASNLWTVNLSGTDPTLTWGSAAATLAGVFTSDGLTLGSDENLTIGSDTLTFAAGTSDFELSDDLSITDATPHLQLIDSTASEDDFELYTDASQVYLTNVTDTVELLRFNASNNFFLRGGTVTYSWPTSDGTNTQVLTTNGSGVLTWQDDDTGAGGGDPILIDGTGVTDASGVDLQGGAGIDITFNAAASPDTASFVVDLTEVSTLTLGAGTFGDLIFDSGAIDPIITGGNATLSIDPGGGDLTIADDLQLEDATPHLRFTDSTLSEDDFEFYADGNIFYFTNVTDAVEIFRINASNHLAVDTNVLYVNATNNRVGIKTVSPVADLSLDDNTGTADFVIRTGGSEEGLLQMYTAGGTLASPTTVTADALINAIEFFGYNVSTYQNMASLLVTVDGTPASGGDTTDMPGRLDFLTTPDGTSVALQRLRINQDGNVTIGQSATDLGLLGIDGDEDEIQLLVQGNATQTTSLVTFETSAGTDLFTFSNVGDAVFGGDLDLEDDTPHMRLTDTTASEDDFEWYADANEVYLMNVTDATNLIRFDASYNLIFRGGSRLYSWPTSDGTNGQFLTTNGSGTMTWTTSSGTDTNADLMIRIPAVAMMPLEAADSIPPIAKDAGTNIDQLVVDFDQSTDECRTTTIEIPGDITAGGTVTFAFWWYSASVTTNEVIWDIRHNSGVAEGVDPDAALTTIASAADTVQGTAGQVTKTTFTETQTNLAWAAGDLVDFVACRDADNAGDDFAADARLKEITINIPRS